MFCSANAHRLSKPICVITHIFNISASSVITHHYRIKKKMGIEGKQKLTEFVVKMNS